MVYGLKHVAFKDKRGEEEWRVEALDDEGVWHGGDWAGYVAIFCEPHAEARAREYAAFKNGQAAPPAGPPLPSNAPAKPEERPESLKSI